MPPFSAGSAAVRFDMRAVESHSFRQFSRFGRRLEDALPNSLRTPAVEAIVDRLGRPIFRRTIDHRHPLLSTSMIPLKMRRLFLGFTPRRLLGINGSILAHCRSLNQNKFARICWPPIRLTNPLNLNMVNWVLTLGVSPLRAANDRSGQ